MTATRWARHPDPKAAMIEAAMNLFRKRGYEGVGVAELLAVSGAPRGSLYFHFPGGKEQIAVEAVRRASQAVVDSIRQRGEASATVEEYIDASLAAWAATLEQSNFEKGCLIAFVGLEANSASPALMAAAAESFALWEVELVAMATAKGLGKDQAHRFARAFMVAVEGAIVLARTRRESGPMRDAGDAMKAYVRALQSEKVSPSDS